MALLCFATFKLAPRPSKLETCYIATTYTSSIDLRKGSFCKPVEMPQLSTQTSSRGAAGLILTTQPTWTTVYSPNVDVPRKLYISFSLIENLDWPSSVIIPFSVLILRRSPVLLSSDWQWRVGNAPCTLLLTQEGHGLLVWDQIPLPQRPPQFQTKKKKSSVILTSKHCTFFLTANYSQLVSSVLSIER